MRIAIIGQSVFGARVFEQLKQEGHDIVGVFTIPDKSGRVDQLAAKATEMGAPVFKIARWRQNNELIADVFATYRSVAADLNVLAFCTQFIPMEVIVTPRHRSIIYHPSLLPRHRGASAINWTLIEGDLEAGLTVFWADDGLDTGPILLQKRCRVEMNDTVDSLYLRFMMPAGVQALYACKLGHIEIEIFLLDQDTDIEHPCPYYEWRALNWALGMEIALGNDADETVAKINVTWILTGESWLEPCSRLRRSMFMRRVIEMPLETDREW